MGSCGTGLRDAWDGIVAVIGPAPALLLEFGDVPPESTSTPRSIATLKRTGRRPPGGFDDLGSLAEDRLLASPMEGTGSFMSPNRAHAMGSVNGPAKLPLSDPVFPLFEHDRPDHGLTARTADRAVLVRLRRFLAANHVPSDGIVRQALSTN